MELPSGHTFYFKGTENGKPTGVGFIINKDLKSWITEIEGTSDRIARVVITINKRYSMEIIQVYAPTTSHPEEEVEDLYGRSRRFWIIANRITKL